MEQRLPQSVQVRRRLSTSRCMPFVPFEVGALLSARLYCAFPQRLLSMNWMGLPEKVSARARTTTQAMDEYQRARRYVQHCKALHERQIPRLRCVESQLRSHESRRHKYCRCCPRTGAVTFLERPGRNSVRLELPQHVKQHHPVSTTLMKVKQGAGAELPQY